jgi:hypothetical protein
MLTAAKVAFTDGLAIAAGAGSVLLLTSAVVIWLLLKPRTVQVRGLTHNVLRREPGSPTRRQLLQMHAPQGHFHVPSTDAPRPSI